MLQSPLKKGDIIELTIEDMAFGGAGLGRIPSPSGELVVFIEGVMMGDMATASLTKIKKNYAEARLVKILKPSAMRITPRCKHFGVCGGCSVQFMSYADQLRWKEKIVLDALERLGGFKDVKVSPIIGCETPWFYRNKMEYSFGKARSVIPAKAGIHRSPVGAEDDMVQSLVLGLHEKKSFRRVFDVEECFLSSPLSVEILKWVREWAKKNRLNPHDSHTNGGFLKTLTVREGKNTGEFLVNIAVADSNFPLEQAFTREITKQFPQITSLYRTSILVKKGFRTAMEEVVLAGKPTLQERLDVVVNEEKITLNFEILPQAFFQPNTTQAQLLYGKILEFGLSKKPTDVLDLFCGTGTIGMFFAKAGCHVTGVDLNKSAIEVAQENARMNNLTTIDFHCGDVFKILSSAIPHSQLLSSSLLITDPPRAGIMPDALQKLIELKVPRWIYVSCNPTTLARDLKEICAAGFSLEEVQPVDMFPQTYHVETICTLSLQK